MERVTEPEPLRVCLLGAPSLSWAGQPLNLSRRQARAMLYRLAEELRPVPRDQLAFLFWPDVSVTATS